MASIFGAPAAMDASQIRQAIGQRRAQQQAAAFDEMDFLTKVLLPIGAGVATGLTGGLAAPAALGTLGAVGAGLGAASTGMALGSGVGGAIEGAVEGDPALAVRGAQQALRSGVAAFGPKREDEVLARLAEILRG